MVERFDRLNPARLSSFQSFTDSIITTFPRQHEYSGPTGRWEAKEWLERARMPLLHCGISRAGGLTELARISEMCELAGALLMPHSFASGITDFCNLHFQIASMQVPMVEFRTIKPVTSILRRDLVHPAMVLRDRGL